MVGEGTTLYRTILRLHRTKLPGPMRSLGDAYVKKEFKLHYKPNVEEKQRMMFVREWNSYVDTIGAQESVVGKSMSDDQMGKLNDQQKMQLDNLEKTAKSLGESS